MNSEKPNESPFPSSSTSSTGSSSEMAAAANAAVQRMAQKAHEAVDKLEQTIGSGSERVMGWQQEYGDMARERVRSNPLAAVGIAFGIGILVSKLLMR